MFDSDEEREVFLNKIGDWEHIGLGLYGHKSELSDMVPPTPPEDKRHPGFQPEVLAMYEDVWTYLQKHYADLDAQEAAESDIEAETLRDRISRRWSW